jgi:TetR/AcrR family transcriptional repressor of nem operon
MARPISFDPEKAIEHALELFWKHGFHAVSVEDIVQATGLNRHSLYARFGSKFGLLTAALTHYRGIVLDHIRQILESEGTSRERVQRLLEVREPGHAVTLWERMLDRGCFAIRVSAELRDSHQELADQLDSFGETVEALVSDVIRAGQTEGEFRRDRTPEELASVLVSGFLVPLIYTSASPRTDAFLAVLD